MFGFGKDKSVIKVKFYEGKSETPFAASKVPIEQLPDTFEIDTTMHLGGDDWIVLGAEPTEKTKFRQSGKLNLYLAKSEREQIDINEILYSLPTINNDIAGTENAESLENIAVFREDDWRQFEFVVKGYESKVDEELGEIKKVYENHREGAGFKKLYLREKIVTPLEGSSLTLNMLGKSFGIINKYEGVAFNNAAATVIGGFALQTESGWLLWGQADESGKVLVLNIAQIEESSITGISEKIDKFTEEHGLYLVDWPRLFWCGPGKLNFSAYGE